MKIWSLIFLCICQNSFTCNSNYSSENKIKVPDVGWAPTPSNIAAIGLNWISVGPQDKLYELGCGDGRVAIVAAHLGAEVICVELDSSLAALAQSSVTSEDLDHCITVVNDDLFNVDISSATVIYLFLLPSVNERLRPILEAQLKPGTWVISREFEIPGWPPGERLELPGFLFLRWQIP